MALKIAPDSESPVDINLATLPPVTPTHFSVPPFSANTQTIERHGFARLYYSFIYAFQGILYAVRTQQNMRIHLTLAVIAIGLGFYLHISPVEFAMIFIAITSVVIAEMFNTVAEACVDLATTEYHPLAKIAKDVAAGAVLMNAGLSVVIALFIFGPHLIALWWHH